MKPFFRFKGKYADNRAKVYIVYDEKKRSMALPKPEILMKMLKNNKTPKKSPILAHKKRTP